MSIKKQPYYHLATSRARSCSNLQPKPQEQTREMSTKQRQQKLIQHLLNKKTTSTKKVFTDETAYTYKPQISNLPVELYPETRSQIEISKQKIFERLIDNMKSKQENFKLLKLKKEEEQFKQTCSFVPQISQSSKAIILAKLKTQTSSKQPFTRLYRQGLEKKINLEKEYMTAKERELTDEHTFQPEINPISKQILNSQSRNMEPIFRRFEQVMQRKRIQQKQIQEERQKQIEEMARVKVENKKTLEILENNQNYQIQKGNVVKRLLNNYFKTKQEKTNSLIAEQHQKLKKQCPFRPKINSNYLLMNASTFDPDQDFLDRQKDFEEAQKENIQLKANQLVPSFKPEINKLSQLICKERQYQTLQDKLNRLNYQPLFQKQAQIQELQKSLYKECKFHPEINSISKALQGPLKPHTCKCHPAPVNYNFKPEINKKSKQMTNNKSVELLNRKKKEESINKIKMEKEYNQLVECTFQPKIKTLNKDHLKLNQNTADFVPGVKEFVEKRNQAMKKKIEEEKYKEKVFNLEKRYKMKTCTTVQQFKLSHQVYESKGKKQLIKEAEQQFKKQHPFRPNIELIR